MAKKKNISQRARFIKAAREAECSEDEAEFDQNLKRIAKAKTKPAHAQGDLNEN